MRKLSEISAPILPVSNDRPSYRRRLSAREAMNAMTCLVLVLHHHTERAVFVSDDDSATGAVWLPKSLIGIEKKDRGRFIVVNIPRTLASQKNLATGRLVREYTPDEQAMLKDALASASAPVCDSAGRAAIGRRGLAAGTFTPEFCRPPVSVA